MQKYNPKTIDECVDICNKYMDTCETIFDIFKLVNEINNGKYKVFKVNGKYTRTMPLEEDYEGIEYIISENTIELLTYTTDLFGNQIGEHFELPINILKEALVSDSYLYNNTIFTNYVIKTLKELDESLYGEERKLKIEEYFNTHKEKIDELLSLINEYEEKYGKEALIKLLKD